MSWPPDEGGGGEPPRVRPFLGATQPTTLPRRTARAMGDRSAATVPRPFVLTSGRVGGYADIGLHTQVTTRIDDLSVSAGLAPELRAIVALCVDPLSIAEISARLHLHLGVAKILVGDLRAAGYLDVHFQDNSSPYDADTILRVINGLRAFS